MSKISICCSTAVKTIGLASVLFLAAGYASTADAAGGCGFGYHRAWGGGCALNHPGPWARPAPFHPGCWRNAWGRLRCHR
jgi:hypothetical protein